VFSATLSSQVKELREKFSYSTKTTMRRIPESSFPPKTPSRSAVVGTGSRLSSFTVRPVENVLEAAKIENNSEDLPTSNDTTELDDSAWAAMESEVVVAATPTKPSSLKVEVRGSEDLLVPDSEAESDSSPRKPALNLGRFAFGA
jgi:exonuclease-1